MYKYHILHMKYIMGLTGSGAALKIGHHFGRNLFLRIAKLYQINSGHSRHDKSFFPRSLSTKQENKTHHL